MCAMNIHASALAMDFSQSLASFRQRLSHAKVRSTTHLLGITSKPVAVSERLTIWMVQLPIQHQGPDYLNLRFVMVRWKDYPQVDGSSRKSIASCS